MAYEQQTWATGDLITADKLNHMEEGIATVETIKGDQGEKGDTGEAATIEVGEVTTLEAGSQATVTNSGTSSAAVFNFGIPKGEQGEQGIQGEKGDQGEQGIQGEKGDQGEQGIQGEKGEKGDTGEAGADGADGVTPQLQKSDTAIQVSYDNGTSWSDLVELSELKGDKGDTGEAGADGADGKDGADGTTPDMSDYYTKTEVDSLLGQYSTQEDITEATADLVTSTSLTSSLSDYYTKAEIDEKVEAIETRLTELETLTSDMDVRLHDLEDAAAATSDSE